MKLTFLSPVTLASLSEEDKISSIPCSICGRPLTDPESIKRGMGPECFEKTGGAVTFEDGEA